MARLDDYGRFLRSGYAWRVYIDAGRPILYVAAGTAGLLVYDITDAANPVLMRTVAPCFVMV